MIDRLRTVLVFGAGGQLGHQLMQQTAPDGFALVGLTHADIDIADRDAVDVLVRQYRPDFIVNAAAYTAVDKAETDVDRAFAINETGPRNLSLAAHEIGAVLVHLSTDYVFDGCKTAPYLEVDPVAPMSAYGRSKEAGERAVRELLARHLILRTAWIYAAQGSNFFTTMVQLARRRDSVRVVADQQGTPTAAGDIARAILAIIPLVRERNVFGTFHLTNSGQTTWHGFAQAIFGALARNGSRVPRLEAITTSEYAAPARRPAMSVLGCEKINDVYGIRLQSWSDALNATFDTLLARDMGRGGG